MVYGNKFLFEIACEKQKEAGQAFTQISLISLWKKCRTNLIGAT